MSNNDLDMLKSITEQTAIKAQPGGRFGSAEEAVSNILELLRETASGADMWQPIYGAVKSAYIGQPDWGESDE